MPRIVRTLPVMHETLTKPQRVMVIAAFAGCDLRTAKKYLEGGAIRGEVLRARLEEAARKVDSLAAAPIASAGAPCASQAA